MFENKRKVIIISLIAAVVILLILILVMLFWPKQGVGPGQPGGDKNIQKGGQTVSLPQSSPERVLEEKSYPLGLKQLAMSFAERYGSYSSDSGVKNLNDLMPFATDKMIQKMRVLASQNSQATAGTSTDIFQGFTTKALSFELGDVKTDQATVTVNTQRLTYLGPGREPNISYRKIELTFVKVGSDWKVDDASWK